MIGVCIVTYNQEQYIAQAIESVLMQEPCGHEVVAYVGDDCSTDRTGEICDEIANRYSSTKTQINTVPAINQKKIEKNTENSQSVRIKVIHNEKNLGLVGNTMNLLDIMRKDGCDYIAMLDGDDYWSDPKKLQKQMAYFDAHPEYGLVHTYVDVLYPEGLQVAKTRNVQEGDISSIVLGHGYRIANTTVIFKTELLNYINFDDFQHQGFMSCDYIMYIIFACHTKFGFLPEHTAVWRRGHDSVSNPKDMDRQIRYVQNALAMWRYAAKLYPERWTAEEQELEDYLHSQIFKIAFKYGDRNRALQEMQLMSPTDRRLLKIKVLLVRSRVTFRLYHLVKRVKELAN